jgi:transcriptional regulator GlxA family with amidase domain
MRRLMTDQQLICAVETAFSELEANLGRPVQLRDIAAAIGMSERTLRHKFVIDVGTPPMRYLRLRRLAMAQQALRHGGTDGVTVTEVALIHGFSELGRFAVTYRRLFGECPSTTLRRSANDPDPSDIAQGGV